jgi:hypothetical protein
VCLLVHSVWEPFLLANSKRSPLWQALHYYHEAASDFQKAQLLDPMNKAYNVNYKDIYDVRWVILRPSGEERDPDVNDY